MGREGPRDARFAHHGPSRVANRRGLVLSSVVPRQRRSGSFSNAAVREGLIGRAKRTDGKRGGAERSHARGRNPEGNAGARGSIPGQIRSGEIGGNSARSRAVSIGGAIAVSGF